MRRFPRVAVLLSAALLALLTSCGGATEADREACSTAAGLVVSVEAPRTWEYDDIPVVSFADPKTTQQDVKGILAKLSATSSADDRLVRAIDRARADAQTIIAASTRDVFDYVSTLNASLSAIDDVCHDLGT